jgi:hypothetical protein
MRHGRQHTVLLWCCLCCLAPFTRPRAHTRARARPHPAPRIRLRTHSIPPNERPRTTDNTSPRPRWNSRALAAPTRPPLPAEGGGALLNTPTTGSSVFMECLLTHPIHADTTTVHPHGSGMTDASSGHSTEHQLEPPPHDTHRHKHARLATPSRSATLRRDNALRPSRTHTTMRAFSGRV